MSAPIVLDAAQTLSLSLTGIKLIEASAGTGKTYAISNLYLRYVLAGFTVNKILVVTFTNAATEELRGRIRARLYVAQRVLEAIETNSAQSDDAFLVQLIQHYREGPEEALAEAIARLRFAVRSMETAAIFTINGFCQRALSDYAFNSGQAFQMDLIRDDDALWRDALKDWWRRSVYELTQEQLALFMSVFPNLDAFLRSQSILRNSRGKKILPETNTSLELLYGEIEKTHDPLVVLAQRWAEEGLALKELLLTSGALARNASSGYRLAELKVSLDELDGYFADPVNTPLPKVFEILTIDHIVSGTKPTKVGKEPALDNEFFYACQQVQSQLDQVREQFYLVALQHATEQAHDAIEKQKDLTRTLSFQDQLTRLHDALYAESGEILASVLRNEFPVAMIDEFQDTDALQYKIFRKMYPPKNADEDARDDEALGALTMIGDPKQAIYSFRGGDIFAYAMARHDVGDELYTLDTNWRSVPPLVSAVNTLFQHRPSAFVYDKVIDFHPVHSAEKDHALLVEGTQPSSALTFWQFGDGDDNKPQSKSAIERQVTEAVADETARLLIAGRQNKACLGDKGVKPGDIAILVRRAVEGRMVREALQRRGINAVTVGRDSVFNSDEAHGLLLLLKAVVHCRDRSVLRAAVSSHLLALNYEQMSALLNEQDTWQEWLAQMKAFNAQWTQRGFMAMFSALLQGLDIGGKLASQQDPERRLTNLLHLGELLQQSSRTHAGLESLLTWYQEQLEQSEDEESEMRLESDEALVKIVTIHASKGLEYPIVFVPFLWACKPKGKNLFDKYGFTFHDADEQPCLALNSAVMDAHLLSAEKERLAEDVRLAYVALTRARAKLYLVWGAAASTAHGASSALAWLLHADQSSEDLDHAKPFAKINGDVVAQALNDIATASDGAIEVTPLPGIERLRLGASEEAKKTLTVRAFHARVATDWRINSFSSLTRDVHQPPMQRRERTSEDAIMNFLAGSQVGLFLHAVLEHLDFQGDINTQAAALNEAHAKRFGLVASEQEATIVQWLNNIVATPLSATGLCLSQLGGGHRLNELAFDFAIDQVRVGALNQRLEQWAGGPVEALTVDDFRGMITGVIDLVFVHEGRYYIADYKSNLLGYALDDYRPEALRKTIFDRRYDLQYLLYLLALHRYLGQRLEHYDYDEHIGGAYYLFLRGMRPEQGHQYGVYFDLPPKELIQELDEVMFAYSSSNAKVSG